MRAQRDLTRQQVEEHSGHEVKGLGDGSMVAFTTARQAVACAVGIQRALEEHNRQQPLDEQVQVRIGLNTGEVIHEEEDLFGEAVNAAARIAANAKGRQILVSEMVKGLLGRTKDVELTDRGRFRLKGFPERWRLFEIVWQEETAVAPALLERTPFVGREAERAELRRLLDQVAKGQGAMVMIGGEPGVGKTRLAEELMAEARERGMNALIGHCYEMEGAPPYIPYVEILEAAARMFPPDALREILGDSAPEVAKLMPELRRLFPDIPASPELPPEQERRYLFNGVREFVARAARDQPLLLVLDDLHWATDAALLLLQHLAQQIHEMPVLIVGTYRDVELDVARPLARALEELTRQRLAHRLPVKRLPEAGVSAMLHALSGQEPPKPLVDAIYSETEGNPFFVEEVFQHLAEEGKLFDAKGRWLSDLDVSELDVPEGVRLVVGRRLERVSDECRQTLTSAAVIGRRFSFELLEALGDVETDLLLDAIDEAERAQLITALEDGPAQTGALPGEAHFIFAHELIRQTLISGLSMPRRQRMHLRVAEGMERVYAQDLEEHAVDLAHHLYQAGAAADPEKTVRYLMLAGEQAMASAAFEDALRHYDHALALQPADDRQARADLLYKRGTTLRSLDRLDDALKDWEGTLAIYEESGDPEAVGRVCYQMAKHLGWAARMEEAFEIASRGLTTLGDRVSAERCLLLSFAAVPVGWGPDCDYAQANAMIEEAVDMARGLSDQSSMGQVLRAKVIHHHAYAQPEVVVEAGLRGAELLRSAGNLYDVADALSMVARNLLTLGRFDEAASTFDEVVPLATRMGHSGARWNAGLIEAPLQVLRAGDLNGYEERARSDLEFGLTSGMAWIYFSYLQVGLGHFWRGRWHEAREYFDKAAASALPGPLAGSPWGPLFFLTAYVGERDAALEMVAQQRDDFPRPGQANPWGAWESLLSAVEGLAVLGERDEAARLYPMTLEAIETGAAIPWTSLGLLQTTAGIAAACGRQWDEAEGHYQTALRQAHELPHKIGQPEVRRWYARMLIDRDNTGDRPKARELLTEAVAMYRQIGMPRHLEMAEAMLGEV